jgi:hypothetical protein
MLSEIPPTFNIKYRSATGPNVCSVGLSPDRMIAGQEYPINCLTGVFPEIEKKRGVFLI